MQTNCSVYIATSLDGFIAKPDGDVNWLHDPGYTIEGEDFGYNAFMKSIDALIMGRLTFDKVLSFGEWHYKKPVIVLSKKRRVIPAHLMGKVRFMDGEPPEILEKASKQGFNHLYIDGGKTIQQFLNAGLIDKLIITIIPVLLGEGVPLFGKLKADLKLELLSSSKFGNGFTTLTYKPIYQETS